MTSNSPENWNPLATLLEDFVRAKAQRREEVVCDQMSNFPIDEIKYAASFLFTQRRKDAKQLLRAFASLREQNKPLPFRGGVGVGAVNRALCLWRGPTPSPSPEGEGSKA